MKQLPKIKIVEEFYRCFVEYISYIIYFIHFNKNITMWFM